MPERGVKITHTPSGKLITHNAWAYSNHGCRCGECTLASTKHKAEQRERRATTGVAGRPGRPPLLRSIQDAEKSDSSVVKA